MPKPTFFQAVLGKPSRKYADGSYGYGGDRISPYADPQPDYVPTYAVNRYPAGSDTGSGSVLGNPSRRKKKTQPSVTLSEVETSRRTSEVGGLPYPASSSSAFPKAKPLAQSTVVVSAAATTLAKEQQGQEKRRRRKPSNAGEARERQGQLTPPSSVSASGSSSTSSHRRQRMQHAELQPTSLSRPAGWSVGESSIPQQALEETVTSSEEEAEQEEEEEIEDEDEDDVEVSEEERTDSEANSSHSEEFSTPPASHENVVAVDSRPEQHPHETPPAKEVDSYPAFSMNLQPPTPAPVEAQATPFAPDLEKPVIPPKSARRRSSAASTGRPETSTATPILGPLVTESVAGEDGSDYRSGRRPSPPLQSLPPQVSKLSPAHSRSNSYAMSDGSVPFAGSAAGMRTRQSRNSFNDFVVHPPRQKLMSEYDSRPPSRAASVYSVATGPSAPGGGGWAAARSGASTPSVNLMRMPAPGSTGFEDFHVPIPAHLAAALSGPKRQSRFTPLPPKSVPSGLERMRAAEASSSRAHSVASGSGRHKGSGTPSPVSEYSQASDAWAMRAEPRDMGSEVEEYSESEWDDGDDIRPSRSYAVQQENQRLSRVGMGGSLDQQYSQARSESRMSSRPSSPSGYLSRSRSPAPSVYSMARTTTGLDAPSTLDPAALTFLPEMPEQAVSEAGTSQRKAKRANSLLGFGARRGSLAPSDGGESQVDLRSRSVIGLSKTKRGSIDLNGKWDGSSYGDGVLLQSDGTMENLNGYSSLILPTGAYKPSTNPTKHSKRLDPKLLGLPHSTMCTLALSSAAHLHSRRAGPSATPSHLRGNLPSPVDFSSHHKPPGKVGDAQVLVQVYAVAIDHVDIETTTEKGKSEVGKWIPGRSFVGRCITTGAEERDMARGDLVMGLMEIRKSGCLAEYVVCDRRRLARIPAGTELSIEQLACLPLQGIPAYRAVQTQLARGRRALILDAHDGVGALMCQLLSKAGVIITAVIPGGDHGRDVQAACMANGAKGVLIGDALTVMESLDDNAWDFVLDSVGGRRAYEAARRILKEGGQLVSLWPLESTPSSTPYAYTRPSGFATFKAAFTRKDSKYINYSYLAPAGTGGAEVDISGQDTRDVLENPCFDAFRPNADEVLPFEKGGEAFISRKGKRGTYVVKIVE